MKNEAKKPMTTDELLAAAKTFRESMEPFGPIEPGSMIGLWLATADALEATIKTAQINYGLYKSATEDLDRLESASLPRHVQTVAELEALPEASVVRDLYGCVYEQLRLADLGLVWWQTGDGTNDQRSGMIDLPARVLFTPPLTDLERLTALRSTLTPSLNGEGL